MTKREKPGIWKPPSIGELNLSAVTNEDLGPVGDPGKAAKIVIHAAERGDPRSQLALGFLYADGTGVPADRISALMWTEVAAASARAAAKDAIAADAIKLIGHLSVLMSEPEIAKARELARAWRRKPA